MVNATIPTPKPSPRPSAIGECCFSVVPAPPPTWVRKRFDSTAAEEEEDAAVVVISAVAVAKRLRSDAATSPSGATLAIELAPPVMILVGDGLLAMEYSD